MVAMHARKGCRPALLSIDPNTGAQVMKYLSVDSGDHLPSEVPEKPSPAHRTTEAGNGWGPRSLIPVQSDQKVAHPVPQKNNVANDDSQRFHFSGLTLNQPILVQSSLPAHSQYSSFLKAAGSQSPNLVSKPLLSTIGPPTALKDCKRNDLQLKSSLHTLMQSTRQLETAALAMNFPPPGFEKKFSSNPLPGRDPEESLRSSETKGPIRETPFQGNQLPAFSDPSVFRDHRLF